MRGKSSRGTGSTSTEEDEEKTYEGRHWQLSESAVNLEGFETPTITLKIWLKDGTEALIEIERETYIIEISRFEAEKPMPEGEFATFQKSIGPQLLVTLNHLEKPCNWTNDILHPRRGGRLHADRGDYVLSMPAICLADNGANDEDEDDDEYDDEG